MGKTAAVSRELTPAVTISSIDRDKLARLLTAYANIAPDVCDYLSRELERAKVVGTVKPGIVQMGSWVRYRDETTAREQDVQLVFPEEADISARKISVMTPIGAALLGVPVGKSITFYTRSGEPRDLTIVSVNPTTEP